MSEEEFKEFEKKLAEEGMPEELPPEDFGKQVPLGDGLGGKTDKEEDLEDSGEGHSQMCPIVIGHDLNDKIDQPGDRPLEKMENK